LANSVTMVLKSLFISLLFVSASFAFPSPAQAAAPKPEARPPKEYVLVPARPNPSEGEWEQPWGGDCCDDCHRGPSRLQPVGLKENIKQTTYESVLNCQIVNADGSRYYQDDGDYREKLYVYKDQ
jgi:hypothetical protein